MDISHISAGRANATSRAIGHPSSRTQETSRRRRREKMSGAVLASWELFLHQGYECYKYICQSTFYHQ